MHPDSLKNLIRGLIILVIVFIVLYLTFYRVISIYHERNKITDTKKNLEVFHTTLTFCFEVGLTTMLIGFTAGILGWAFGD